eukprot:TRINITY_DN50949_c0_g1_i1.p1 TRINITY_DN50949_c0_g1~~TRINITY_DN50949_c0_g1_i1.p1  ORF type:complete len:3868 (+),score=701.29 TRINITY_DN50949_c0_g1_i1:127-11730(+)
MPGMAQCPAWRLLLWLLCCILGAPQSASAQQAGLVVAGGQGAGAGASQLRGPMSVVPLAPLATSSAEEQGILIADTENSRVQLCRDGRCDTVAGSASGSRGPGINELSSPYTVTVLAEDRLLVTDTLNNRVLRVDIEEDPLRLTWRSEATELASALSTRQPVGIALATTSSGTELYVADSGNHRVLRYRLDEQGAVLEEAEVVAGSADGKAGNSTQLLDNPTAIFVESTPHVDGRTLWIADARNRRIMRWRDGEAEGTTVVQNTVGRPYGVAVRHGAVYYADADACVVRKHLLEDGVDMDVAGTSGRCGGSAQRLKFPGGIHVEADGSVLVADSGNHRIVRWNPEPSQDANPDALELHIECALMRDVCEVTVTTGNPLATNLMAVVEPPGGPAEAADVGSRSVAHRRRRSMCGRSAANDQSGTCTLANLTGFSSFWTRTARPSAPMVRGTTFSFGMPVDGEIGVYHLCWGAVADEPAVLAGNCSSLPHLAGTLEIRASFEKDEDGTVNQCVRNAKCLVTVKGYAVSHETWLLSKGVPAVALPGARCGGVEDWMDVTQLGMNPGRLLEFARPHAGSDNVQSRASVELVFDFKDATRAGRFPLCACMRGSKCSEPHHYDYDVGTLRIRGAGTEHLRICYEDEDCDFDLFGTFLASSDRLKVIPGKEQCGSPTEYSLSSTPFAENVANVERIDVKEEEKVDPMSEVAFSFGVAKQQGVFRLCYCPSYRSESTVLNGMDGCSQSQDFLQDAGTLMVWRVREGSYICIVNEPCFVDIRGWPLKETDEAVVEYGDRTICGRKGPIVVGSINNLRHPIPGGNETLSTFDMKPFGSPGRAFVCYCSTYDGDFDGRTCLEPSEFFQVAGQLLIRGPRKQLVDCAQDAACSFLLAGTGLSTSDRLQIYPGDYSGCPNALQPVTTLVQPREASTLETTVELASWETVQRFSVGKLPRGVFTLCYCVGALEQLPGATARCGSGDTLTIEAGLLRVRGPHPANFSCVANTSCSLEIAGYELRETDKALVVPRDGKCGESESVPASTLAAASSSDLGGPISAAPEGSFTLQRYNAIAYEPGLYRVCYCTFENCSAGTHDNFHLDVGLLLVKGLVLNSTELLCRLGGAPCNFRIGGYGLDAASDAVQVIPRNFRCGGQQVVVSGSSFDASNGVYSKEEATFDGRAMYKSERQSYLFFDVYASRWILGWKVDPDLPKTAGWAWAAGAYAMTPERNLSSAWKVWDPTSTADDPFGKWAEADPPIDVRGSAAVTSSALANPARNAVLETVLEKNMQLETFTLGRPRGIGIYRMCFCASMELTDFDDRPCSADDEFAAEAGFLVVHALRGGEWFHCTVGEPCFVQSVLSDTFQDVPLEALLMQRGSGCTSIEQFDHPREHRRRATAKQSTTALDGRAFTSFLEGRVEGTLEGGVITFDFGLAKESGHWDVCACLGYRVNAEFDPSSQPCARPEDFFQQVGTVTVVEEAPRVQPRFGDPAILNISGREGLSLGDRLRAVKGTSCREQADTEILALKNASSPFLVGDDGDWAAYTVENLPRGRYAACLCAAWDGPDEGTAPCDSDDEFLQPVGAITVSAIDGRVYVAAVTTSLLVRLQLQIGQGAFEATAKAALAALLQLAIRGSLAAMLRAAESSLEVTIEDISPWEEAEPSSNARRLTDSDNEEHAGVLAKVVFAVTYATQFDEHLKSSRPGCGAIPLGHEIPPTCMALASALNVSSTSLPIEMQQFLRRSAPAPDALSASPAIQRVVVLQLLETSTPAVQERRPSFKCLVGRPCEVDIRGNAALTSDDALLAVEGSTSDCGEIERVGVAPPRLAEELSPNPATPRTQQAAAQRFVYSSPRKTGTFSLCYCWAPEHAHGQCSGREHFVLAAGVVSVLGVAADAMFTCRVWSQCTILLKGQGLTPWDKVLVAQPSRPCGEDVGEPLPSLATNPALSEDVLGDDGQTQREFRLGVASEATRARLCYCSVLASSCSTVRDFAMEAGRLAVRGPMSNASAVFRCPKTDPAAASGDCTLTIDGVALWLQNDAVLLTDKDAVCGSENTAPATQIAPNPAFVEDADDSPGASESKFTDAGAVRLGGSSAPATYQMCWCSAGFAGDCRRPADFSQRLGLVTIAGAVDTVGYTCKPFGSCMLNVSGWGLSMNDTIAMVAPSDPCGVVEADGMPIRHYTLRVSSVTRDGSQALFFPDEQARATHLQDGSARLCYCTGYDGDGSGIPCDNITEFTHVAGYLNLLVCPAASEDDIYIPPVEDVFGGPGQPELTLFVASQVACDFADANQRLQNWTVLPTQQQQQQIQFNRSVLLSSRPRGCDAVALSMSLPRLSMATNASTWLAVGNGEDWGMEDQLQTSRQALALWQRNELTGRARIRDSRGLTWTCPTWSIRVVPYACTAEPLAILGVSAHLLLVFVFVLAPVLLPACQKKLLLPGQAPAEEETAVLSRRPAEPAHLRDKRKLQAAAWLGSLAAILITGAARSGMLLIYLCFALDQQYLGTDIDGVTDDLATAVKNPIVRSLLLWILLCSLATVFSQLLFCVCIRTRPRWRSAGRAFAATLKFHIDVASPLLLRAHHCEFWRPAALFVALQLTTQVLWPLADLLRGVRMTRLRNLPDSCVPRRDCSFPRPLGEGTEVTAHMTSSAAKQRVELLRAAALERYEVMGLSATLEWFWQTASSRRDGCSPEEVQRRRVDSMVRYLRCSGLHMAADAAASVAKAVTGTDTERADDYTTACDWMISGLDMAAFQLTFLATYATRLAWPETLCLLFAVWLGVALPCRRGASVAYERLAALWLGERPRSAWLLTAACFFRTLMFVVPLLPPTRTWAGGGGCPWFLPSLAGVPALAFYAFVGVAIVVVLLWFYRARSQEEPSEYILPEGLIAAEDVAAAPSDGARSSAAKPTAAVSGPGPPPPTLRATAKLPWFGPNISGAGGPAHGMAGSTKELLGKLVKLGKEQRRLASTWEAPPEVDSPIREDVLLVLLRCYMQCIAVRYPHAFEYSTFETEGPRDGTVALSLKVESTLVELVAVRDLHGRMQRLADVANWLQELTDRLKVDSAPPTSPLGRLGGSEEFRLLCNSHGDLKGMVQSELESASSAAAAVALTRCRSFRQSSLGERGRLVSASLPHSPGLVLVHWRALQYLRRLPDPGCEDDADWLTKAEDAHKDHGRFSVVFAAVHKWRSSKHPDPSGHTARQLLAFAQWYRRMWGIDWQPYFWVDYCCLPQDALQTEEATEPLFAKKVTLQDILRDIAAEEDARMSQKANTVAERQVRASAKKQIACERYDSILPIVFACCDAVVFCDAGGVARQPLCRVMLGLAYAFSPAGKTIYALDKSIMRCIDWHEVADADVESDDGPMAGGLDVMNSTLQSWTSGVSGSRPAPAKQLMSLTQQSWASMATDFGATILSKWPGVAPASPRSQHSWDSSGRRTCKNIVSVFREHVLEHPLAADAKTSDKRQKHVRTTRAMRMALADDAAVLSGDFHRPPLSFGASRMYFRHLGVEGSRSFRQRFQLDFDAPKPKVHREDDSASSIASEEEQQDSQPDPSSLGGRRMVARNDPGVYDRIYDAQQPTWEDRMLTAYLTAPKVVQTAEPEPFDAEDETRMLRKVAAGTAWSEAMLPPLSSVAPAEPWDRAESFHKTFVSSTNRVSLDRRSVQGVNAAGGLGGGVAVTAKPLQVQMGVAPDEPLCRGVAFEVYVTSTGDARDAGALAIGFTAQDPAEWPKKKAAPRRGHNMPRTWLGGYGGKWFFERRALTFAGSATVRGTAVDVEVPWEPTLQLAGDVVTIVAIPSPLRVLRLFINKRLVAEESFKTAGFPDPLSSPLWGIVDVNGSCTGVALTETPLSSKEQVQIDDIDEDAMWWSPPAVVLGAPTRTKHPV